VGAIAFTVAGGLAGWLGVDDSDVRSAQATINAASAIATSEITIRRYVFFINPSLFGFKISKLFICEN
jgi:hypothetical protein